MKLVCASLSLICALALSKLQAAPTAVTVSSGPQDEESLCKVWVCESPASVWSNASMCEAACDFACDVDFVC
jgi:hypothetical protein